MHSAHRNNRTHVLNIFLMLSVSIACIVGVELFSYFYLIVPAHMPPVLTFEPSQSPPKRLKQNANAAGYGPYREFYYRITTDTYGFRKTYPFEDNRKTYSVAILGDSQSFGVGVNDEFTFASLIAKNLSEPVLNAACPGYNTIEEFLTYKDRIQPLKPHYVLLFFFAGNDPYENYKNRELYYGTAGGQVQNLKPLSFLERLKKFLVKRSAIYNMLIKLRQYPQLNRFLYRYKLVNPASPPELAIFKKDENPQALAHWQITERIISDLRDAVESNGSQFWIIFIPDRYQVDKIYWQRWISKYNLKPQDFDLIRPNWYLAEFSKRKGIHFEDTTESLIEAQNQGKHVYWKTDAHLNGLGNQVIADFIASRLSKQYELMGRGKEKI